MIELTSASERVIAVTWFALNAVMFDTTVACDVVMEPSVSVIESSATASSAIAAAAA